MNGLNIGITSISSDKNGTIYVGTAGCGLYKSTDGTNFTPVSGINFDIYYINCIAIAPDGTIYVGAEAWSSNKEGLLYISKDGTNFTSDTGISEIINDLYIYIYIYIYNGTLYFTTGTYKTKRSLYKANLLDYLLDIKKSYYYGDKYNGLVYNQEQKINIKQEYLKNDVLDGATITIPATNVNLDKGTHTLTLN
ncbi:WD40/YVTN/BNR-like repeat-containing protein [Spiroplasma endosymbiont of Virgichneumon dumeticola]|uniref:WD40/YVTN/BNR-like repeat-containing protein n=1 Tax=Spiroplasma endosymbiont of Virgichneumon dumeticola TaxID=3139323 RepID=UPI0035C91A05